MDPADIGVSVKRRRRHPGRNRRTDEHIAAAVNALRWNLFMPADKIKVTVNKGWVTLEGEVKWQFQKNAAVDHQWMRRKP